jgi:hypothetical protein
MNYPFLIWIVFLLGHNYNDQVKKDEMGGARSTNGEKRNAYRILVGKPEVKRPVGRPRLWCVKMDLKRDRMGRYGLH